MSDMITSKIFNSIPYVVHGFGMRGVELRGLLRDAGMCDAFCLNTNQIHGDDVHYVSGEKASAIVEADAFITDRPRAVCFVRTADCVPILIADARHSVVCAIHAGWRGAAKDIAGAALCAMSRRFGTEPGDCVVAIGPRICADHYEVGAEVVEEFKKLEIDDHWLIGEKKIDLGIANKFLLVRAGIQLSNIDVIDRCTYCDKVFASWRRDRLEDDRQFNFIVIDRLDSK